jgi:hypothetical protein
VARGVGAQTALVLQRACALAGCPDRFVHFYPAFPRASARIDPLHSFNRATELASRVAAQPLPALGVLVAGAVLAVLGAAVLAQAQKGS